MLHRVLILFDDGVCEEIEAEEVSASSWRLKQTPLASSTSARLGDVVELTPEGKIWRFQRVAEPASHVTIELLVPKDEGDWGALRALFDAVSDAGGEWERAYGGLVLLHVPAHAAHAIVQMADALRTRNG